MICELYIINMYISLLNNENINQFTEIDMRMNLLDISSDSKSMNVINQLTEIGVEVLHEPQK